MTLLNDPVFRGGLGNPEVFTVEDYFFTEQVMDGTVSRAYEVLAEPAITPGKSPSEESAKHLIDVHGLEEYLEGTVLSVFDHAVWLVVPWMKLFLLSHDEYAKAHLLALGVARIWPNLPLFPQSSTATIPWTEIRTPLAAVNVPSDGQPLGKGVTWAVIDTDVRDTHLFLSGYVTRYEVVTTKDASGNSVTTVQQVTDPNKSFANRFASNHARGHGTHVAGILRAVAPEASIASVALECQSLGSSSTAYKVKSEAHLIAALEWARDQTTIHGVNLSLGISPRLQDSLVGTSPVCKAVTSCVAKGKPVVVSAGNYGSSRDGFREVSITDPANAPGAIVVGACEGKHLDNDTVWPHSSHGPTADGREKPDLVAPGVDVSSCKASADSGVVEMSGTSQAAPFVSGACAVLLSRRLPTASQVLPKDIVAWLTADPKDLDGRLPTYQGKGRLDVESAVVAGRNDNKLAL